MQADLNWQHILTEGAVVAAPTLISFYVSVKKIMWRMGSIACTATPKKKGRSP